MIQANKNPFDSYSLYARVYPALICAVPLFVLWYFLSEFGELSDLMSFILSLKFMGSLTLGIVFLYFYAQLIRTASKLLEKRYLLEAQGFPTMYFMLYGNDTFSKQYKELYREKVLNVLEVTLPSEDEERADLIETKKRLHEITKHIILHVGNGQLVLKHNVWYGYFRNLVGGALFASIFSCLNIYIGVFVLRNQTLWISSVVMLVVYAFLILWRKGILTQHAEAYAKQLIAEFMESNKKVKQ